MSETETKEAPPSGEVVMEVPSQKAGTVVDLDEPILDLTAPDPPAEKKDRDDFIDLTRATKRRKVLLPLTKSTPEGDRVPELDEEGKPKTKVFEVRLIDDFGLAMQQRLLSYSRKYEKLFNNDEPLSEKDAKQLDYYHDEMFSRVLVAEEVDRQKIDIAAQQRVVTTFSRGPLIDSMEENRQRLNVVFQLKELGYLTDEQINEAMDKVQEAADQISTS